MRHSARVAGVLAAIGLIWWGIHASGSDPAPPADAIATQTPTPPLAERPFDKPGGIATGAERIEPSPFASPAAKPAALTLTNTGNDPAIELVNTGGPEAGGQVVLASVVFDLSEDPPCPADFNKDGAVDGGDFESFTESYHSFNDADTAAADLNGDGFIDFADLEVMQTAMEQGCPKPAEATAITLLRSGTNVTLRDQVRITSFFQVDLGGSVRVPRPQERPARDMGNRLLEDEVRNADAGQ